MKGVEENPGKDNNASVKKLFKSVSTMISDINVKSRLLSGYVAKTVQTGGNAIFRMAMNAPWCVKKSKWRQLKTKLTFS